MNIQQESKIKSRLSGGCQCGAIRFEFHGIIGDASICHCRMCQKAFGNFGAVLVNLASQDLNFTRGIPSTFRSSAIVERGFCKGCGTPLYMREDGDTNFEIAVGTLDNPNVIGSISRQSGVESQTHWFNAMHQVPKETTTSYRTAEDMLKLKSLQHPDHDT